MVTAAGLQDRPAPSCECVSCTRYTLANFAYLLRADKTSRSSAQTEWRMSTRVRMVQDGQILFVFEAWSVVAVCPALTETLFH